jgi:hypothetical protein
VTDMTLYQIADAREILDTWLLETEGEVTPELEALLAEIDGKADEKIERVALYIREQLALATAAKEEQTRIASVVSRRNKAAESLKLYLHREMERLGKDKVTGLLATIAIQKNPPSVKGELSPETLKDAWQQGETAFVRHVPESFALDRKAVVDAFKAGQPIPDGLEVVHETSLRIR